ncbi:hypothetical protein Y032_0317g2324 [Ancylostoma ceylanicum]|uniref:Uncharacterized protein n=1 Tax=Ancylostoma ceylanicum TaxID=53326 RepID=A0A016S2D3_9BILA|nr:hypothetical protein Y032_0317g2324 [Ancylostoma ceylanicum]
MPSRNSGENDKVQSFQKILASGIHRPSAEPCHASYTLSYVVRRGSVDAQCIVIIMHRRRGADQQTGGGCRRQVLFGRTVHIVVVTAFPTSAAADNGHGAKRPPCNTVAMLLRGAGLSIDSFFQAPFSAFLFISARIFTFATHFFEFFPSPVEERSPNMSDLILNCFRLFKPVF